MLLKNNSGKGNQKRLLLYSIPLIILLLFFLAKSLSFGYSDYASYYFGSKLLLSGNYNITYETSSLNLHAYFLGFKNLFISYTPFPPFTSIFFSWLTLFPIELSKIIFNCISCMLFLFTLYRSIKYFSLPLYFILLVPLIFFTPIRSNIFFGQSYVLLFIVLIEGYIAYKKGQLVLSSVLWGFAIVFKIFPLVILFYLLIKKEYRRVVYLLIVCVVFFLISLFINGYTVWKFYIFDLLPRLNNGELNDSYTFIFQSAFMLFKNIFSYDILLNPNVLYHSPFLFSVFLVLFKVAILSSVVLVTLKKSVNDLLSFGAWITASLLISPNGSTYSLILLLIPFLGTFTIEIKPYQRNILVLLLILICNVPILYFSSMPLLLKFPRLYLLLLFFIMVVVINKPIINYKVVLILTCILSVLELPKFIINKDKSSYFLKDKKYELIYNYNINDNNIIYNYWSRKGGHEETVPLKSKSHSTRDLKVENNQIYYKGKRLTNSSDWKRSPTLMDGKYIIYLSDKNRGIGFYTMRKLDLD